MDFPQEKAKAPVLPITYHLNPTLILPEMKHDS